VYAETDESDKVLDWLEDAPTDVRTQMKTVPPQAMITFYNQQMCRGSKSM
jgi:hypothetical protein